MTAHWHLLANHVVVSFELNSRAIVSTYFLIDRMHDAEPAVG